MSRQLLAVSSIGFERAIEATMILSLFREHGIAWSREQANG
jgi:hypothetical protein